MRGATRCASWAAACTKSFQSTRPMRGATLHPGQLRQPGGISIHAPHAGRDLRAESAARLHAYFNPRAPCGARLEYAKDGVLHTIISIHAPHAGRDSNDVETAFLAKISIHAPHAGRDGLRQLDLRGLAISIHAPHAGRDDYAPRHHRTGQRISIHAPHAGRDSKSIQNYFKHFCDKRQFLDNFTQNTAFQSVLPLADRQKLLYLRCEPLRKFLRAFASHYKIIGSSGR